MVNHPSFHLIQYLCHPCICRIIKGFKIKVIIIILEIQGTHILLSSSYGGVLRSLEYVLWYLITFAIIKLKCTKSETLKTQNNIQSMNKLFLLSEMCSTFIIMFGWHNCEICGMICINDNNLDLHICIVMPCLKFLVFL